MASSYRLAQAECGHDRRRTSIVARRRRLEGKVATTGDLPADARARGECAISPFIASNLKPSVLYRVGLNDLSHFEIKPKGSYL